MSESLNNYYRAISQENSRVIEVLHSIRGARCLITGANGIIGYALTRLLDSYANVDLTLATRKAFFQGGDFVSDNVAMINYDNVRREKFDYIFHCATHSQPTMFLKEWQSTVRLNTDFLLLLLDCTKARLVYMSSTEIYSGLRKQAGEGDSGISMPQHPRGIYIESKRLAEAICNTSGVAHCLRIAPTAGPYAGKSDTRLIFELIRRAFVEKKLSLRGGYSHVRQFQYSGASALRILVGGVSGGMPLYNCAGPYILTIEDLARSIAEFLAVPYFRGGGDPQVNGASDFVSVSMERFNSEFPELCSIDPSFNDFLSWLVEDYIAVLTTG